MKPYLLFLLFYTFLSCERQEHFECNEEKSSLLEFYIDQKEEVGFYFQKGYDSRIHEFTFYLNKNSNLCKIGYQSQPKVENYKYEFELIDVEKGEVIFRDSSTFNSNAISYFELASPIMLQKNKDYTIRRIFNYQGFNAADIIGNVLVWPNQPFPLSNTFLTIKGSQFYDFTPGISGGIPYINIVFSQ